MDAGLSRIRNKRDKKTVEKILSLEPEAQKLTDGELQEKTKELKEKYKGGSSLDSLMVPAYALVREATYRATGLKQYPVQILCGMYLHRGYIAEEATGEGKAVTVGTKMPTPLGWKKAGDIREGDLLFARNGLPTVVSGVYPQGWQDVYEVELSDGRTVRCADEHRWAVYDGTSPRTKVMTTKEMLDTGVRIGRNSRYRIPICEAAFYPEMQLPLDPYLLGCLLGSICRTGTGNLEISSIDTFLPKRVARAIDTPRWEKVGQNRYAFYREGKTPVKVADIIPDWYEIDIFSDTKKKIPEEYKTSSIGQRWALVQGLFDTGGTIERDRHFQVYYRTMSRPLAEGLCEILYSLGVSCEKDILQMLGKRPEYIISVKVPNNRKDRFFRNPRKRELAELAKNTSQKEKKYDRVSIRDIRKTGEREEMVCFSVSDEEHLFLCGDYVVTHNTLAAAMPAYLNALTGEGVQVVTVNDYLAKRDAENIGRIHRALGLTVGCVTSGTGTAEKQAAYGADITYVTNTELGFDYLRDNIARRKEDRVQRGFSYCIIDEADSVLIDEARTPLIISAESGRSTKLYMAADFLAKHMIRGQASGEVTKFTALMGEEITETGDYVADEKTKTIALTKQGMKKAEQYFASGDLSDTKNNVIYHTLLLALRANTFFQRDRDYMVKDGEVLIVDEFTGRAMPGRRYSDGLHQALEAKEGCPVKQETFTQASITYQNLFNKYKKKSGMTGTAATERTEFSEIYHMKVRKVPTNRPVIRKDDSDIMFVTKEEKYAAVLKSIQESNKKGQPVLVGTKSIAESEEMDRLLDEAGIPHTVLNAKQDAKEAEIIAKAGHAGAVTVATNMAGRGTDIVLDEAAREAGGLKVIGTSRHDARRIDNQLRGRSGRQGDPGESRFYLSLDDSLLKLFGSGKTLDVLKKAAGPDGEVDSSRYLSAFVRTTQKKVELGHFAARKQTKEFDDVNNRQRELIYKKRSEILDGEDMERAIIAEIGHVSERILSRRNDKAPGGGTPDDRDTRILAKMNEEFAGNISNILLCRQQATAAYIRMKKTYPNAEALQETERQITLAVIDRLWMAHLNNLEILRQNVSLAGYGQTDPVLLYKAEASRMFREMIQKTEDTVIYALFHSRIVATAGAREELKAYA